MSSGVKESNSKVFNAHLELRSDLRFHPRPGADPHYMVEDPQAGSFFRMGVHEYKFATTLKPGSAAGDCLQQLRSSAPDFPLSDNAVAQLCVWLQQAGMLAGSSPRSTSRSKKRCWNPLTFRLKWTHPELILTPLTNWLSPLFGRVAASVWVMVVFIAAAMLLHHWPAFVQQTQRLWSPAAWLPVAVMWFLLKVVHESAHGIVCKRYGGRVPTVGLLFILFAPVAFIDVSSSCNFPSRWRRIAVAGAGMYAEVFLAAVAVLLWAQTDTPFLAAMLHNLIVAAGCQTVLVNLNPLMRYDGYYILSDLLNVPNLYTRATAEVNAAARKWLLGLPAPAAAGKPVTRNLLLAYGAAAILWRMLMLSSLCIAAAAMFQGLGLILAIAAGGMWFGMPLVRWLQWWWKDPRLTNSWRIRCVAIYASLAFSTVAVALLAPYPWAATAPAVVEFEDECCVRSGAVAFVVLIAVQDGDTVKRGDLLFKLQNDDLHLERASLETRRQSALKTAQQLAHRGDFAAHQAALETIESLEKQAAETQLQIDGLTVYAQRGGCVIAPELSQREGTWVEEGDLLATIADRSRKVLRLSISQRNLEDFSRAVNSNIAVTHHNSHRSTAVLDQIEPRASTAIPHAALCVPSGGPLAVDLLHDEAALVDPRFNATARLSTTRAVQFRAGERVTVTTTLRRRTISQHLFLILFGA